MVIDHNDIDTGRARHLQRLKGLGAAIDSDNQPCTALGDPHQRLAGRTITFHQAIRDVIARLATERAKQPNHQGCRSGAVHVIIAEDGHRLAVQHGIGQPTGRLVHVVEQRRIRHEVADRGRAMPFNIVARHAARQEQLRDQIVRHEGVVERLCTRGAPAPGLAQDRARNAARIVCRNRHRASLGHDERHVNPDHGCDCFPQRAGAPLTRDESGGCS